MSTLLEATNLSKRFGTLTALQGVNLSIHVGEVLGIAGQSGSGKSVLTALLTGLLSPDTGAIHIQGQPAPLPIMVRTHQIEAIHQYPELADTLDVTANLFLGNELGRPGLPAWLRFPDRRRMEREATRILAELDAQIPSLRERARNLTAEQRQLIAIGRAMVRQARLMVIDDPTALLSYPYQQRLRTLIRSWQHAGVAVIFCSDNLDHLFAVADRILILRQGQVAGLRRTDETNREEIVTMMVGGAAERRELTPTIWALDSYYRAREQSEQLRANEMMLQRDLAAQGSLNRQLIRQLSEQVNALDRANMALQSAQRRLLTEREEERKRLARDLHDQVIQDLLSVNFQIEALESEQRNTPQQLGELGEVRASIRDIIAELRRICGNLRPPTIDSLGLGAALQSLTRDWSERSGCAVVLDLDPDLGRLPEAIELSIFRIIQEGLSNVRRHARASQVRISLRHATPRDLAITIADDGRGLPEEFDLANSARKGHYGLLGISERISLLGGRLSLQNQTNGGMRLYVEIPHPRVELPVE
ncbi:MAG: ATP-binding cassette domain-containing protein [Roseiflexaceae bacterium]